MSLKRASRRLARVGGVGGRAARPWLALVSLASLLAVVRPVVACPWPAIGLDVGVGSEGTSIGSTAVAGSLTLGAAWDLSRCWAELPLRAEVTLGTSTRGRPWGRGVRAVSVASLHLDLAAAVGFGWSMWRFDDATHLGLDLLVGPGVRVVTVTTTVEGTSRAQVFGRAIGRAVGGVFFGYDVWRFTLRAEWLVPDDANLLVGAGYQL